MELAPLFSSASDQWATPKHVYEALDAEFGFTYDPCPLWVLGELCSDGLMADWGSVTFCNPPYSSIGKWVKKAHQEWRKGCTGPDHGVLFEVIDETPFTPMAILHPLEAKEAGLLR